MAVIIPKKLLDEAGAKEGDKVKLSLAIPTSTRDSVLENVAGVDKGAKGFQREKRDRY